MLPEPFTLSKVSKTTPANHAFTHKNLTPCIGLELLLRKFVGTLRGNPYSRLKL